MTSRGSRPAVAVAVLILAVACGASLQALTASTAVPATKLDNDLRGIGANDLKPSACSALTLATKVTGAGVISGTTGADLVAGSSGVDTISSANASDCLLGGDGNDALDGGNGTDVCIGGPGTDTFTRCETQVQ